MKKFFCKKKACLAILCFILAGHPAAAQQPAGNVAAEKMVACPMYAMKCPDGSFVSPTGPDCHLPPCPGSSPPAPQPPQPICNLGPMKCPDGTFIVPGPDCKFDACPGPGDESDPDNGDGEDQGN